MRLEWATPAADELESAQAYYSGLNPVAAEVLARRIWDAARRLQDQPHVGRIGLREGTRELVVLRTPYLLVYRINAEVVEILHVWHEKQDWAHHEA